MEWTYIAALAIFIVTYGLIAIRKIGKYRIKSYMASLAGAAIMLLLGILPLDKVADSVEWSVIFLLLGMMALNASLEYCGFFDLVVEKLMRKYSNTMQFFGAIMVITAVLSAIALNDAVVLIFCPIVIKCCQKLHANPIPFLIALFISANIGCAATFVGAPHNAVVETYAGMSFLDYSIRSIPLVAICLPITIFMMKRLYAKDLSKEFTDFNEPYIERIVVKTPKMYACMAVLVATVVFFAISNYIGLEIYQIALVSGAIATLIIMTDRPVNCLYVAKHIEWSLLLFFIGLFIVVRGAVEVGIIEDLASVMGLGEGSTPSILTVTVFSAVLSNLICNVPACVLLGEMIVSSDPMIWVAVAVSASFACNATLIGAATNLICADIGERRGHQINFWEFMKIGVPISVVTILVALGYMYLLDAFF
ncbi:Na+/H+ antiporter NhaD-related arsenite permease [Thermoplasmatales archaeon BRNA1]|nr:Na+/H+ antiporter NhaD-related arsenite permease [Thermoplasmatales archaeon BRNA1]